MPLVSYIRNSLRFWYYASLRTCCQNLEKIGVTGKIWEKAGVKLLRDLTKKSVNFSTMATSNIRLLLVFGEEDKSMKLVRLVRKKFMITKEKLEKMTTFRRNNLPNFIRGSTMIVIPHNVELCKQYFLQECLLLRDELLFF